MHILIKDIKGEYKIRKKCNVRDVYKKPDGNTIICFEGLKNTPITIKESPEEFFHMHLSKDK